MNAGTHLIKMWKVIKIIELKNIYKNTAPIEKMAAIEKAADPKIIADGKIMADVNIKADPKILADGEIPASDPLSAGAAGRRLSARTIASAPSATRLPTSPASVLTNSR